MSLREELLIRVLSERPRDKEVLVLSARNEAVDVTPLRVAAAQQIATVVTLVEEGDNTADEARHLVPTLPAAAILCTSADHQLRAFLTWLRALQAIGRDREVKLWNLPVWLPDPQWETEVEKIAAYQATGDCASFAEGLAYLQWRGP